jgi:mercuric ion transport protein
LGTAASFAALLSAAACCVLPLALAAVGLGAGGLSMLVPLHWPLTILAIVAIVAAWLLYVRKRRACRRDESCAAAPPSRAIFLMLSISTTFVAISVFWSFIEAPLMRLLGGA